MAVTKTSLSAGEIIRHILVNDADVKRLSRNVFPVASFDARLPYIVYRRAQMEQSPRKIGIGADTVSIEVICYTEQYTPGVELAEAVRKALDGAQAEVDGIAMRSCSLVDSEEGWGSDAFMQQLIFNVKI
jgi:hypothetical protein